MPRNGADSGSEPPPNEPIFRYWVEVRELQTGLVRTLLLNAVTKIPLTKRKNAAPKPREDNLQLQDGKTTLEAKDLKDLAAQLRQRYPDFAYARTLRSEHDKEAKRRRADAMNSLIEQLAEIAVREVLQER